MLLQTNFKLVNQTPISASMRNVYDNNHLQNMIINDDCEMDLFFFSFHKDLSDHVGTIFRHKPGRWTMIKIYIHVFMVARNNLYKTIFFYIM